MQKGQALLRVANPEGEWELDLHMPEDRMGHIARAEKLADEQQRAAAGRLYPGHGAGNDGEGDASKRSGTRPNVQEKDEGNVVEIKVAINKEDIDPANLREGATVTGKVHCGRRSLGYVWFHDLLAFIQAKVFFRFF